MLKPKPLSVVNTTLGQLTPTQRNAVKLALLKNAAGLDQMLGRKHRRAFPKGLSAQHPLRVETYGTEKFIRALYHKAWLCSAALDECSEPNDRRRIKKIMSLIPEQGAWPYVSYFADSFESLAATVPLDPEDAESDLVNVNHGDGWHRIIAMRELKLPTVEVIYIQKGGN